MVSQKAARFLAWYPLDSELLQEVLVSDRPREFASSPDKSGLYMTDNGVMQIGNKVSSIDLEAPDRIVEVDLGEWCRPHGIDLWRNGNLPVTTENPGQLLVIDVERKVLENECPTGGQTPHIIRCSTDSSTTYMSNARSRTVARIDLQSGNHRLLETGDRPEGSVLGNDWTRLYVAHCDGEEIAVVDNASWTVLGEIEAVGDPVRCGLTNAGQSLAYGL